MELEVAPAPAAPAEAAPAPEAPTPAAPTALLDAIDADLAAVEATLGRIDGGTFGRCPVCDVEIEAEVLVENPLTNACARHLTR